ncbi:MAG: hypothetical protein ACRDFB_10090 [Rhabdochlamydiaceae bacterium]
MVGNVQYQNVECHCPSKTAGKPYACHCEESLLQKTSYMFTYSGLVIIASGILLFILGWKKQSLTGVLK